MLCPICSTVLNPGTQMCGECGTTIDRMERQVQTSHFGTEIGYGAALCAGIEGYIRMCEVLPLLEIGAVVNEYMERLLPQIQADGGQINWYNGEKIVAFFGLSDTLTPNEAPSWAVRAALHLHETFAEFSAELFHSYASDIELELRVGVATGELLRGALGDAALARPAWSKRSPTQLAEGGRPHYRRIVIGDTVNRAVQLEYEANPGHIVTDRATALIAKDFECSSMGMHQMRRRGTSVELFNVLGPRFAMPVPKVFQTQSA